MTGKKPYSIHKRTLKKRKPVYYVQFRKPDGTWSNAKSTGQTTKSGAEAWAINYLQAGKITFHENITFGSFANGFFDWDSKWAKEKRITGNRISEKWCLSKQRLVNTYLMPALQHVKINNITKDLVTDLRNNLFFDKGLAGVTVNHILDCLRQILVNAEEHSLIQALPVIKRVAAKPKTETGILTMNEVQKLFFEIKWTNFIAYVCNLAAAITGMRKSELLGLQIKNIHNGYIEVCNAWDTEFQRLTGTTKNGKSRTIVITSKLQSLIDQLIYINPYGEPDSFVFYSDMLPDKPIDQKVILKNFYRALKEIGIDETQRRQRHIVFHSHRHFANSIMINARLPLHKVQAVTGHLSDKMTSHYYHLNLDESNDIKEAQELIFK